MLSFYLLADGATTLLKVTVPKTTSK